MVKRSQKIQEVITRVAKRPLHGQCQRDGLLLVEYVLWLEAELEISEVPMPHVDKLKDY